LLGIYISLAFDFAFDFEYIIDELEVLEIIELPSPPYFFLDLDRDIRDPFLLPL
jgi:hypothetical protein